MSSLDWLIARPLAHRGLHDVHAGVIENTASAFSAAIAGGYGIECDVQLNADGEAMVYHDDTIDRLTNGNGRLIEMSTAALKTISFKDCTERMLTLGEVCGLVDGRATLLIEMKSHFDRNLRLPQQVANVLSRYSGPVAVMSFDPDMILMIRDVAPRLSCGLVYERHDTHSNERGAASDRRHCMAHLLHAVRARPQFIAYAVKDLPAAVAMTARHVLGLPLLTWTVRNEKDRLYSRRWADQIIFEGWLPQTITE
jgi:glycerophosphoryl diester phosphodiesterase